MFKYEIAFQKPNNPQWYNLTRWVLPFTDGTTLDDTLDEGKVNLSCTKRQNKISPFSKIRIKIFESQPNGEYVEVGTINRVIGKSKRTRRTFVPNSTILWDWDIQTLEETKLLERYVCDSMMSTNYLSKDYTDGRTDILIPNLNDRAREYLSKNDTELYGPVKQNGEFYVPSFWSLYDFRRTIEHPVGTRENQSATIIAPDGTEITDAMNKTIKFTQSGTYTLRYDGSVYVGLIGSGNSLSGLTVTYNIGVFENITPREQPTITSVCERLLSAGITRRKGIDTQKFTLDTAFAEKYKDIPAPEFSFTRQTLFEALLTVGGYIHAIPRLNGTVVTFDELGGDDEIDITNFPKMVYEDRSQDINDFCATIDSPAQNLVNTQDRIRGSITELGNDYITVRAEDSEVIISDNTAVIRTTMPINQIVKLECGFIDGRTEPVGDITAHVYEAAEYDTLSGFTGSAYPYSKAYALRYAQGDNKITGLQFKVEGATSIGSAFQNYAISNIIKAKTGKDIADTYIPRLAFRVTYVPIVTSRITQRKPYGDQNGDANSASWDNALIYNQGSNTMESSFYGDKMKGAIARLGNQVIQRTYDFVHYKQIPKCGQKIDGMYIARVDCEYDLVRIRATLTLTKDFNMLSQYVGLNSNYRLYDISEKQSVERFINYSENIYVGNEIQGQRQGTIIRDVYNMISCTRSHAPYRGQVAVITANDKDGNDIGKPVVLPVASFPFGNSLVFAFSMYDNYGAGFQNSGSHGLNGNQGVQRLVPYTDGLGELETLGFRIERYGWFGSAENGRPTIVYDEYGIPQPDASFQADSIYQPYTYPQYAPVGFGYQPAIPTGRGNTVCTTGNYPLIIQKDSREALSVVYQAHFVANRQSIVIGPSLTQSNAYVNNVGGLKTKYILYMFDHELNMLDGLIDLRGSRLIGFESGSVAGDTEEENNAFDWEINSENGFQNIVLTGIKNPEGSSGAVYKSWGIVEVEDRNSEYGKLFIGENVTLAPGETAPNVFFMATVNE